MEELPTTECTSCIHYSTWLVKLWQRQHAFRLQRHVCVLWCMHVCGEDDLLMSRSKGSLLLRLRPRANTAGVTPLVSCTVIWPGVTQAVNSTHHDGSNHFRTYNSSIVFGVLLTLSVWLVCGWYSVVSFYVTPRMHRVDNSWFVNSELQSDTTNAGVARWWREKGPLPWPLALHFGQQKVIQIHHRLIKRARDGLPKRSQNLFDHNRLKGGQSSTTGVSSQKA